MNGRDPIVEQLEKGFASGAIIAPGFEDCPADLLDVLEPAELEKMQDALALRARIEAAPNRKERRRLQALARRGKL